jgi:hypothetical protein
VLTVAVVLGAGCSEVFAEPFVGVERPESGNCVACAPCDEPAGGPNCANAGAAIRSTAARAVQQRADWGFLSFVKSRIFVFLSMNLP